MKRTRRLISRIITIAVFVLLGLCLVYTAFRMIVLYRMEQKSKESPKTATVTPGADAPFESVAVEQEDGTTVYTARVVAVGDNLYHKRVIDSGWQEDGTLDYRDMYEHVRAVVQTADLAIADQETVLTDNYDLASGYPRFATPVQAADALVDTGFDVIYSATNHADDYGEDSLVSTVRYWRTRHPEITLLGIHDSREDADTIRIRDVNGIKVAFLEYTYGTNSLGFDGEKSYLLDVFSDGSEKIGEMIRRAKEEADCLIFIGHWGAEDEPMPTEYEKQWAAFLMKQGVDVCIGGHPHNLQPYGWLSDNEGHKMLLFYSLGNFVSNMDKMLELLEGMGCFTIQKTVQPDGTSTVEILEPTVRPMVMHYNYDRTYFRVYFLDDYTEELADEHGLKYSFDPSFSLKNLRRLFDEIMSINVKPSTGTDLLNVKMVWDGSVIDPQGNPVVNRDSISEYQYYYRLGIDITDKQTEYDYTEGYSDGND